MSHFLTEISAGGKRWRRIEASFSAFFELFVELFVVIFWL